jgi:hypothetical protein
MVGIDFNSSVNFGQYTFTDSLKGLANARWTDCFLATDGLPAQETIRQVCLSLPRQLSNKDFFLFRSVPMYGIRSANVPTEPSRYRNLSTSNATQALSLWHPRKHLTNHSGQSKRKSQLENLCRLRPSADREGAKALRQRRFCHSAKTHCVCSRFNNHRFVPVSVSMGKVSQVQSRSQSTRVNGPQGLYTLFYPHYRRKSPRRKHPRRSCFRAGCNLHHGSRLLRLRSSLYLYSKPFDFYHKSQKQSGLSPSLLSQGRQSHRFAMRPDNKTQRILCMAGLSCRTSSNRLLRPGDKQKIRIPNKQFFIAGSDGRSTIQVPLADRNLLQMDQAIPANQNIFRHHQERGEDPNLDCHQRLRSYSNSQETTPNRAGFGRNHANSQHRAFRASADGTSTYEKCISKPKSCIS